MTARTIRTTINQTELRIPVWTLPEDDQ